MADKKLEKDLKITTWVKVKKMTSTMFVETSKLNTEWAAWLTKQVPFVSLNGAGDGQEANSHGNQ